MVKITIKNILLSEQNWEQLKALDPSISQYKIDEVEKMLHCRDPCAMSFDIEISRKSG
jgi:hypothetical protein